MYVVGHDNESMKLVVSEMSVSIGDRLYNYFSDLRPDEIARAAERVIENAVHGHEFPSSAYRRMEAAIWREAAVQPPSDK